MRGYLACFRGGRLLPGNMRQSDFCYPVGIIIDLVVVSRAV